jgi:hypothetical protein
MAFIPPGGGSSSEVVYPPDHIREVAAKILVQASNAQSQHDTAWSQFQTYVHQQCAAELQETMINCTQPYAARQRSSYDWLMSLASALFEAADDIDQAEGQITQAFIPSRTHGPI